MKMILGFPELQEATTKRRHIFWTSKIFNGRMGHSEWLTALQEHPSHKGNKEKSKGTCTQAGTDSNFSLFMLHVGWICGDFV